jgi:hypothetical protein
MTDKISTWSELYRANQRMLLVAGLAILAALIGWSGWMQASRKARAACRVVAMVVAERDGLGQSQPAWMRHRDIDAAESACDPSEESAYADNGT